jgi:hypothetical protein
MYCCPFFVVGTIKMSIARNDFEKKPFWRLLTFTENQCIERTRRNGNSSGNNYLV